MIILNYVINLLVIFILGVAAYYCSFVLKNLFAEIQVRRAVYSNLRLLVSKTTPAKDDQLKKDFHGNKKALKIIAQAIKEKNSAARLYSVSKNSFINTEKVKRMDRREQIVTQLEYKRALRTGEVNSKDAKIIEFPQSTATQTQETPG